MIQLPKPIADAVVTQIQRVEELFYQGATRLKGFPRILQRDAYSCGLQCACMVLKYFGMAMPVQEVRKKLGVTRQGTDIAQLRRFFQQCGFKTTTFSRGYPKTLRDAIDRKSPVIIGMDFGGNKVGDHWAVVYGYRDNDFLVADPAVSRSKLSAHSGEKFRQRWDKTGLVVSKLVKHSKRRVK